MRISVFGPRIEYEDSSFLDQKIDEIIDAIRQDSPEPIVFLWGGAKGVQSYIKEYLQDDFDFILFKPWTMLSPEVSKLATRGGSFNSKYFFYRNKQIISNSDKVIIFDNSQKDGEIDNVKSLCSLLNKEVILERID